MISIVTGGQTGVDRAAMDAALELCLPLGGWCPAGRWAEDGPIDPRYPLQETLSPDPEERTWLNVRDSDGTLLVGAGVRSPGTALTQSCARRLERPVYHWDVADAPDLEGFRHWLLACRVRTLNVAGPRESEAPGVYRAARALLAELLRPF